MLKIDTKPQLLIINEFGHMPIDKYGCELLFQIISARYERASTIITIEQPLAATNSGRIVH